jgi:hypothetical protein
MRRYIAFLLLLPLATVSGAEWVKAPSEFMAQVRAEFPRWDTNDDGELSAEEIEQAVVDPEVMGKPAAAVVSLRRAVKNKLFKLPPLTLEAIGGLMAHKAGDATTPDLEGGYKSALLRIQRVKRDLFVSEVGPALDAVHQGKLGDCFCLAPLGAMLHRRAEDVAGMFAPSGPSQVSVTFGGKHSVSVPWPTDAELALMASSSGTGLWVNIYEKAVGLRRIEGGLKDRPTALSAIGSGGSAGTIVEMVTGMKIKRFSCKWWRDPKTSDEKKEALLNELRGLLTSAVFQGKLICGGVDSGEMLDKRKVPGILGNHAYAILGYDSETDVATLWNPHGADFKPKGDAGLANGYPMRGGRFEVPLPQLVEFFGGFSFETDEPAG